MWVAIWLLIDIAGVNASSLTHLQIVEAANAYDWPVTDALAVAWCESQFTPTAYNGFDSGVYQVNRRWWKTVFSPAVWEKRFEVRTNTAMAYHVWEAAGRSFRWWACGPPNR